ncbi:cytosine permease [Gracilibacillus sp. HCP3S3_G5_1]|uniref:cytosine permease n=1 Tax=unclassified Gracilibacillus TaxID=2625209 RepID=UPI003F8A5980
MSDRYHKKVINDFEREPVPQEYRKGWGKLSLVWMGGIIALSAVVLGSSLGAGLTFSHALIATFIGTFLLAILSALCSVVGAKTGLSTSLVSMFALGRYGAFGVSVILAIALLGWFGVQLALFGDSLQNIISDVFGITVSGTILILIGGVLMTLTAVIGYKAIEKLSMAAVPLLGILLVASLIKALNGRSFSAIISESVITEPITIGAAISLIIGSLAIGAIIGPDISRYAKTAKDAVISSFVGYFLGYSIVLIVSILLAKATAVGDIVAIMIGLGWGSAALLVLILAQWTTNDNNLYSSALGFATIFQKVPKFYLAIGGGAIGTILAVAGIYDNFIPFLNFLSAFIPPIGGIYVATFLIDRSKFHFSNLTKVKSIEPIGISVWVVATVVAFMTTPAPTGFGLFQITGAAGFDAFLIAFILQLIASKMSSNISQQQPEMKKEVI